MSLAMALSFGKLPPESHPLKVNLIFILDLSGLQVSMEVLNNDLRPAIPKKTPDAFVRLMKKCWDRDPSRRPSFKDIIKDLQTMKL
jgi:hypothetical protein